MRGLFINNLFEDQFFFFSWILFIVFSISCHEYMHAKVALMEGDDTAARRGHLTLNPFKQMGVFSLIMLCVLGFCWGNVPVNPNNFRNKYSNLKVSLAGPLTNLVLAIVFTIIASIPDVFHLHNAIADKFYMMFFYGAMMNVVLFVFNMLPIPGLDGWALISSFVSSSKINSSEFIKGASLVLLILAFQFIGYIFRIAGILVSSAIQLITLPF